MCARMYACIRSVCERETERVGADSENLSIYLPLRLNPRGGHQKGSGKPSVEGG